MHYGVRGLHWLTCRRARVLAEGPRRQQLTRTELHPLGCFLQGAGLARRFFCLLQMCVTMGREAAPGPSDNPMMELLIVTVASLLAGFVDATLAAAG